MRQNEAKADAIRNGTYFRQGGGAAVRGGPEPDQSRALPAPSPSNRPGASSPADRFRALTGSGMSKQDAYQRLQEEGY